MPIINSINASLVIRNDTAENWRQRNPILLKGEIGAEIDTNLLKLGDGVTPFNELQYINQSFSDGGVVNGALTLNYIPTNNSDAVNKEYVDSAITSADGLTRSIVTELPQSEDAEENVIYMIKDPNVIMGDAYKEYLKIDGALAQIGDTSVNLTNYLQKTTTFTEDNIVIFDQNGGVKDSGKSISDITATIPPATTTIIGGVLSSLEPNSIYVDGSGRVTINDVSVHKLYVPQGDELILNGGGA